MDRATSSAAARGRPREVCLRAGVRNVLSAWGRRRREDIDTEPREFRPHRFAETVDREFACGVLAFDGHAAVAEDRADVDHDWLIAFAQDRQSFADEFHRREEVYFHDRADAIGIRIGETAVSGDSGVVDQDVEAAELVVGRGECTLSNAGSVTSPTMQMARRPSLVIPRRLRRADLRGGRRGQDRHRAWQTQGPVRGRCRWMRR